MKASLNRGESPRLSFWRDHVGNEVDLLEEKGHTLTPTEIKSGATFASDWSLGIKLFSLLAGPDLSTPRILYGGDSSFEREGYRVLGWRDLDAS